MKITRALYFRINVEIDGLHYSLQESCDGFENLCVLRCKETKETWGFGYKEYSEIIKPFVKKQGVSVSYNEKYDIEGLERFIKNKIKETQE